MRPIDRPAAPIAPFPACACGRLRRATRALTQLYDDAMMPAGLRVTQFSLLRTLARDGALRISDLAARQLLDRTALSRNLDPLVAHGFVKVLKGDDARTREAAITREGSAALKRAEPHWARAQKIVAQRLGTDRLEALIATLGELESLHPDSGPSPPPAARRAGRGSVEGQPRPSARRAVGGSTVRPSKRS
jgi:DNA-binding MarR family transcriptional regulator